MGQAQGAYFVSVALCTACYVGHMVTLHTCALRDPRRRMRGALCACPRYARTVQTALCARAPWCILYVCICVCVCPALLITKATGTLVSTPTNISSPLFPIHVFVLPM